MRLFLLLPGLLVLLACGPGPTTVDAPPPGVSVIRAGRQAVTPHLDFIGRVQAVEDASLMARVPGYIIGRDFEEGQRVEAGTVLFSLDEEPYRIAADQARGRLQRAEAEADAARRAYARAEELQKADAIAATDFDEARNRRDQALAAVAEAEAQLAAAAYDLKHTQVRAPFDGQVGEALYSIGDYVGSQQVLTTLVTTDPMHVYLDINEKEVADFRAELPTFEARRQAVAATRLGLTLPNGATYGETGRFDFFDNRIDPRTGSMKARAVFPNPAGLLNAGQFVSVRVTVSEAEDRIVVPLAAVQQDQLGPYVMVVEPQDTVAQRRVELGPTVGVDVVVEKGLAAEDRVITEGLLKVRAGMRVSPTEVAADELPEADQGAAPPTLPPAEPAGTDVDRGA